MDQELPPPYSTARQRESKEFSAALQNGGKVEGTLTLLFDAPLSQAVPTLLEGSALRGNFRMNVARPSSISSVAFGVEGEIIFRESTHGGLGKNYFFLRDEHSLWSSTDGEPHTSPTDSTPVSNSVFRGSLQGEYTWPISVELQKEIVLKKKNISQTFTLPQFFDEHSVCATIVYRVWVKVVRRGLLKPDKTLSMPFAYLRVTRPPPLPPLRQLIYQEGSSLLGPSTDPDSSHTEGPIQIKGSLSKTVPFSVQCTLYLAKPLAYTAGNVIPLSLRMESENIQALDLISVQQAIHVRVRRYIVEHHEGHVHLHYSQKAVWWTSHEPNSERVRVMSGEIHLKPGMSPNSEMGNFKLKYSVMLYDFTAVALHFEEKKFLQEVPIKICTFYGPGPHPIATTSHNTKPDVGHDKQVALHITNGVINEFY